jgi:hypothetical protein
MLFVTVIDVTVRAVGWFNACTAVLVHPLESLTTILYVPSLRLLNVPDVWNVEPLFIEYRSVPVPPDALIEMTPSDKL